MANLLKPFVINSTDIQFILDQLNFRPLFDAAGNAVINWDGTGSVFDRYGTLIGTGGALATDQASIDAIVAFGSSYQSVTDLAGLRDVTGLNNNLALVNNAYGAVDQIFTRSAAADYANYSPILKAVAEQAYAAAKQYYSNYAYAPIYADAAHSTPVTNWDGTGTVYQFDGTAILGGSIAGDAAALAALSTFGSGNGGFKAGATDYTITLGGSQHTTDGTAVTIQNIVDYTPRMISLTTTTAGVTYDTWANHTAEIVIDTQGNPNHTTNEIYYDAQGVATVLNWGQLETVANGGQGQVDTQARLSGSAGQDDHFIGGLNPGVSPSNGFFVLFGQFFDHGLDFIDKGGQGATIKIALAADDPLYGQMGPDGRPVHEITINRATVQTVDANGPEYVNHTSPFIDQSQTYGSHEQLTTLLREWVRDPADGGSFHAGMSLFDGKTLATQWTKADGTLTNETLPTLNELQAHVIATGRDALTWDDVSNLRNRDASGHVIAGTSGSALILDMNPRFDAAHLYSSTGFNDANHNSALDVGETTYSGFIDSNQNGTLDGTEKTQVQVVNDAIATLNADVQTAYGSGVSLAMVGGVLTLTGLPGAGPAPLTGASALYPWVNFSNFSIMQTHPFVPGAISDVARSAVSDILLASVGDHYIAGDGRVNENFGLTSIHHIFHEEHNYQVQNLINALYTQDIVTNDVTHDKLHEFQVDTGHGIDGQGNYVNAAQAITWDLNKLFNGAKLIVEMEYQHAAVDQYARNVTPNIQEFVGYSPDKNPAVSLEYSQAAFRFGHSTLRETIDTIDPTHGLTGKIMGYALKEAFLSPEKYQDIGPAAVLLGMSHQQMNEVDEFVTPALNQGLLGQPLDLAAINIARGRDLGLPTLNDFREAIGLVKYTSWNDFGQNMQHQSSLVNFIAAYAFDGDMATAEKIIGLVDGTVAGSQAEIDQAYGFLNGDDTAGGAGTLAFNHIDTWIGGLAEIHQPGGLLGETFDKVFVNQIESLMDGDRFYYLFRLAGQQFAEEVGNGQLKDIVERNTGLVHLNGNIFGYADQYVDLGAKKEVVAPGAEAQTTGNEHKWGDIAAVDAGAIGVYSNGGRGNLNDGHTVKIGGVNYIQDTRLSADMAASHYNDPNSLLYNPAYAQNDFLNLDGTPNSGAESNEVIVGSKGNDLIYAQGGDDTVYGDGGNDTLLGGFGIDRLYGGDGADKLYGGDNPDLMDGGSGDDFLYGESSGSDINGADQLIGGSGNDTIYGGTGIDKLSGGSGDDKIYGDQDTDPFTHGSDGNDYVSGDSGGDILYGDNGDDVVVGGADQDQLFGNDGDDILRPGDPTGALTIGTDEVLGNDGVNIDDPGFDLIDFSDNTVRAGGVTFDLSNQTNPAVTVNGTPSQVQSFQMDGVIGSAGNDTLTGDDSSVAGAGSAASIAGNNWIIGGSGSDTLIASGGNDIIVGGSIRLDALIGKYNSGYTHNNANAGLDAAQQLEDARYQGASQRVLYSETIDSTGIIDAVNNTIAGTANDFQKHFTELLRSYQFKDTVLGNEASTGVAAADTGVDTAVFTGDFAKYSFVAVNAAGQIVPTDSVRANWANVVAFKVTDNRTAADLIDANGNPIVDANGNPVTLDGTDIVIGVENLKFADQTVNLFAYYDKAPVVDLHYVAVPSTVSVAQDDFTGGNNAPPPYARGTGWAGNWIETGDNTTTPSSTGAIQVTGNGNPRLEFLRHTGDGGDGASISRGINLSGLTAGDSPKLNFSLSKNGIGANETLQVQYTANGTTWTTLKTYGNGSAGTDNGTGNLSIDLAGQSLTASSAIRFAVTQLSGTTDYFRVDDVVITKAGPTTDQFSGNNFTTSYTEQLTAAAIAATPLITDPDDTTIVSARVDLRDAIAGDTLTVGTLPAGITASVATNAAGHVIVNLAGTASHAAYQTALAAITFASTSDNPTNANRHIDVTVNDGYKDSAVATTTVSVTPVNDPTVTGDDNVVTNIGVGTTAAFNIAIPDWALLANDTDPDSALTISSIGNGTNGVATSGNGTGHNGTTTTVRDNTAGGGTFTYTVNGVTGTVTLAAQQTGLTLNGTIANDILIGTDATTTMNGGDGNDIIFGNGGSDTLNGGAGDDTISYSVTTTGGQNPALTSGHDFVDGGTNASANPAGDRFVLSGSAGTETFRIFSNTDDWDGAGAGTGSSAAHAGITGLNANTEIVITRNGTINANGALNGASVLAELDNIEEITINSSAVSVPVIPITSAGDTINVIGNFTSTSLNFNTITIDGSADNDTVDISALLSAHRIVFRSNGGQDAVLGTLRPQDVIVLPPGHVLSDYVSTTDGNGVTTLTCSTGSISYKSATGSPHIMENEPESLHLLANNVSINENTASVETVSATGGSDPAAFAYSIVTSGADAGADGSMFKIDAATGALSFMTAPDFEAPKDAGGDNHYDVTVQVAGPSGETDEQTITVTVGNVSGHIVGTPGDDVAPALIGTSEEDVIEGLGGIDRIMGLDGNDIMYGGDGNDVMDGGAGADTYAGGLGNDAYYVRNFSADGRIQDNFTELVNQGIDGVNSINSLNLNETRFANIENGYLSGSQSANLGGNASDNVLVGNAAANMLFGLGGNDTLNGGGGSDTLIGGTGNDTMYGGTTATSDNVVFMFASGFGNDVINNFDADGGNSQQDFLDVTALMGGDHTVANFNAHVSVTSAGADTLVTIGADTITIKGVALGNVNINDFHY